MKIFALTGGLATGKTTVAGIFRDRGVPVLSADAAAHRLLEKGGAGRRPVSETFGPAILRADGSIDRQKLGRIVFDDPGKRHRLEALLHPLIRNAMEGEMESLRLKKTPAVLLEIPLLFESGWDAERHFDAVIVVASRTERQIERGVKKWGLSEEEVRKRLRAQIPLAEKIQRADFVIRNDGSPEDLRRAAAELADQLIASSS